MSVAVTSYEALVSLLETTFPSGSDYFRLPNPYKPEENSERYLLKGWGIAIGPSNNSNRFAACKYSVNRGITIILTRKYHATESDVDSKETTEKALLEDQNTLIESLESDSSINGATMYSRYVSDGGIEYVRNDTDMFLMIRTQVELEYIETFT